MASKLFVNIDMFTINQDISLIDNGEVKYLMSVPIENLDKAIYSLVGSNNNINDIELHGNKQYIQKTGYKILEGLNKIYADRNVRITINGEVFN